MLPLFLAATLPDDVFDDLALYIRQAEIPARVTIRELFMVHAKQVQSGGVKVVHVHQILRDLEAEIVSGAIDRSGLSAAARQQHREAVNIVIPAVMNRPET